MPSKAMIKFTQTEEWGAGWSAVCLSSVLSKFISFASTPTRCPRVRGVSPAPCPGCIGTQPRRSGRAKVDVPLPPKLVPKILKREVFWSIGISCPSQNAHPLGAKFPANIVIWPMNGSTVFSCVCRAAEGLGVFRCNRFDRGAAAVLCQNAQR